MSHTMKLGTNTSLRAEMSRYEQQYGFMPKKKETTTDAVFALIMSEGASLYLCRP